MTNKTYTAEEIVNANAVLCALSKEKMPLVLAYKIMKWCKSVEDEVAFYAAKFREIVEMCSVEDENGNFCVQETKETEFQQQLADLRATEMSCRLHLFTIDELSCLRVSPADMLALYPFVKE